MLDPEHGTIQSKSPLALPRPGPGADPGRGQPLVATFQDRELGGTALWGIDPESGVVAWKTVVGSAWHDSLARSPTRAACRRWARDGAR